MGTVTVRHNPQQSRFETDVNGELATLDYEQRGNSIALTHTKVPRKAWNMGIGSALARAALEYAQGAATPVIPECEFVVTFLKRNPKYLNIVDSEHRRAIEAHQRKQTEGGMAA
ncbi:MAG TPA: GNAT family N-acetyltransferase [Terriglobales bacterium]|nr:GNAT family N-acetyltransferase [Terriglobales bacterium]